MTLQNEKFEELLSRQLAAELEPQRGRAVAAFKAQMAAEKAERESRQIVGGSKSRVSWATREISKPAVWLWTGVPSLVAACLAVVLTLQLVERPTVTMPGNLVATTQPVESTNPGGSTGSGGVNNGDGIHFVNQYEIQPDRPLVVPPAPESNPYRLPE